MLNLLEEEPVVYDVTGGSSVPEGGISLNHVDFAYQESGGAKREVLKGFNASFDKNAVYGILGKSGCGKSTLLKLLMRFYETDKGSVAYGGKNVNEIDTDRLREHIAYVTQDTFLFEDTIENNIKIANENATRAEVEEAAKKASIHEFIQSLLDEPTSNIDSLNEGIILKSLYEEKHGKQIILVSHRKSTMAIADEVLEF